ncbi:MAG: PLP-dependent transferase [Bacillota bacterium]|nr:PLP-dependent transferase [Bacillota bacterium]MDI3317476.1 PLP-dependent transferase [Bacillota bacterium]
MELRDCSPATVAVHAGERRPAPTFTPTVGPIYASNTYVAPGPTEMDAILGGARSGFTYTRHHNPTVAAFEEAVALLEGAEAATGCS